MDDKQKLEVYEKALRAIHEGEAPNAVWDLMHNNYAGFSIELQNIAREALGIETIDPESLPLSVNIRSGWVIVPFKADAAMLDAGAIANGGRMFDAHVEAMYNAMIWAAPDYND